MKRIWQLVLSMSQVFNFLCFLILIAQRCSSDCHLWLLSLRNSPGPSFCLWLLRPGSIFYKSSLLFFNIFNPLRACSIFASYYFLFDNILNLQPKKQKYSRKTAGLDLLQSGLKMTKVSWTCWPNLTKITKLSILNMLTELTKVTPSWPSWLTIYDLVDKASHITLKGNIFDKLSGAKQAFGTLSALGNEGNAQEITAETRFNCVPLSKISLFLPSTGPPRRTWWCSRGARTTRPARIPMSLDSVPLGRPALPLWTQ